MIVLFGLGRAEQFYGSNPAYGRGTGGVASSQNGVERRLEWAEQ
jgi:hypothetical protein